MTLMLALSTTFEKFENFDPIMMYSKLPWKNVWVDFVYGLATMLLMLVIQMTWSWLYAIPGCLAFQYECLLKGLAVHVKFTRNSEIIDVMEYWCHLEYSTRVLFENGFSKALFTVYFISCVQQTITSFFIFNVIRNGGGWEEVQVLLFDFLVSLFNKIVKTKYLHFSFFNV